MPRGSPKDMLGLHLIRRLRYMDHAPGSSKAHIMELYTHARTLFVTVRALELLPVCCVA
jgi:hypothetical protein